MFLFQGIVLHSLFLQNMKTNVVIEELIEFWFLSASNIMGYFGKDKQFLFSFLIKEIRKKEKSLLYEITL